MTLALQRGPSKLQPGPEGTRPISYPRLIQPILDRSCAACHDGSTGEGKSDLVLTGEIAGQFTQSYESLRPFVRVYEWGAGSIHQTVTVPGRMPSDESPLTAILSDETHRQIGFTEADRQRLYLWLDANAPFYGTYSQREQLAQQRGEPVAVPELQ
jgi:hypothetical protein